MSTAQALPHPLLSAAIARPRHPYFNDLTFGELCERVQLRAQALVQVRDTWVGARIGLCGSYDERWIEWAWALNWLGVSVALLNPQATENERAQTCEILDVSEVIRLPFGGPAQFEHGLILEDTMAMERTMERTDPNSVPFQVLIEPILWEWEQVLFVLTSSGTTGTPKAISLTTRALTLSAFGSMVRLGHDPGDCWLSCLPFHHVGGLSILTRALLQQTSVRRCQAQGKAMAHALMSGAYQLCSLTPTLLDETLDALLQYEPQQRLGLKSLRVLLIGGAKTNQLTWEKALELELPIRLTWGMSEAASQVCTQLEPAPPGGALPPLPFQHVQLDHQGCLTLTSPTTETGYYTTQDLGQIDEKGWICVLGRRDDVVISGGVNIHPQEIEERLIAHPCVFDAAVVGVPDPKWGEALHAYLQLVDGAECPSNENLQAWCKAQLSPYKCPKAFHWRPSIPRDSLGKLQRRYLIHPSHESEGAL